MAQHQKQEKHRHWQFRKGWRAVTHGTPTLTEWHDIRNRNTRHAHPHTMAQHQEQRNMALAILQEVACGTTLHANPHGMTQHQKQDKTGAGHSVRAGVQRAKTLHANPHRMAQHQKQNWDWPFCTTPETGKNWHWPFRNCSTWVLELCLWPLLPWAVEHF